MNDKPAYIVSDQFSDWRSAAKDKMLAELTYADCIQMYGWAQLYGNANGWSGSTGKPAIYIMKLLRERERLLWELECARGLQDA